jgi:2'-hydroxyisoflavone reductase
VLKEAGEGFPIWAPYFGEYRGFHTWKNDRAVKAGLKFRPYAETAADTLKWYKSQPENGRTKLAGPAAAKEAELLAKWKASK